MFSHNFLPSYPHRIAYLGAAVLVSGALLGGIVLAFLWSGPAIFPLEWGIKEEVQGSPSLDFSVGLKETSFPIPLPHISQELFFSVDSPRPDQTSIAPSVFVKIKKTGQFKRVVLPCNLYLEFIEGEKLRFSEGSSPFWLELNFSLSKKIEGKVFIETPAFEKMEAESFLALAQEPLIYDSHELREGSPFRLLSEAKWSGSDKFKEKYDNGALHQKIELSHSQWVDLKEGDWLVWTEDRWAKSSLEAAALRPIARIKSVQSKSLVLEGWEGDQYIHLALNHSNLPWKIKGEDLFNSIRIRSAKQISCMLEKQWLILKLGDWVLKNEGRWKILKKKEERDLYCAGKIFGELFVFEKIETKLGQKWIQGYLFSTDRSQMLWIDLPATIHGLKKGKNETDLRKGSSGR